MKIQALIWTLLFASFSTVWGQSDHTTDTSSVFHDTRVINGHSVETLGKKTLDFRIVHRFGDVAVNSAGRTLYGLDISADIRISFEYGITDKWDAGFGRSKGAGPLQELWDAFGKYQFFEQTENKPLALSSSFSAFFTSMKASSIVTSPVAFFKTAHRFSYYWQVMAARRFGNRASLQIAPGLLYRNLVAHEDDNAQFNLAIAGKVKILKNINLVAEYSHLFRRNTTILNTEYKDPLAFGIEIVTYAHIFQLNFMNSAGIGEGQYIPYTTSDWLDGEFRFGFTIGRQF